MRNREPSQWILKEISLAKTVSTPGAVFACLRYRQEDSGKIFTPREACPFTQEMSSLATQGEFIPSSTTIRLAALDTSSRWRAVLSVYDLPHDAAGAYLVGQDAAGNIFGVAWGLNGVDPLSILFKLDISTGSISRIYTFTGGTGGPMGPLIVDSAGNTYGVEINGLVFKITPQGQEKLLYDLAKKTAGLGPGFAMDGAGNLYGYTYFGGTYNGGTIYKLTLKK
jgi:uncharacterized repeat protein (TIGR03803 family)